jgi:hypothetical protein
VQEQTRQPGASQLFIELTIAIAVIEGNRVAGVLRMNADLVSTPSYRAATHQRREGVTLFNFKTCLRGFAFLADAHNALTALQNIFQQRRLHHFHVGLPLTADQRQVIFLHPFLSQLFMQRTQRRTFLRHQQDARSVTVKTMNQFQESCFRAQST